MMLQIERLKRVSWECIHFAEVRDANHAVANLQSSEFAAVAIGETQLETEPQFLSAVAEALAFPDYFGMNWNALDECLRDMEWMPAKGYVVFFFGAERLWCETPQLVGKLVSSWLFSAEEWGRNGVPFHLVFVW